MTERINLADELANYGADADGETPLAHFPQLDQPPFSWRPVVYTDQIVSHHYTIQRDESP